MGTRERTQQTERRSGPRGAGEPGRRVLFGVLRWIAGHVRGFYAALGVFLVVALAAILLGVVAFLKLAGWMVEGETLAFDNAVLLWMHERATPKLTDLALNFTALGAGTVVWVVVIVASVFLWVSRHRYSAALLWVSLLGSGLISTTLKASFSRPRPDLFPWRAPYAGESSFPSGHSMTAMVAYTTLAFLIARLEPSRGLKRFTFCVAALIITAVGLSRMYLGVHYPSDVLAGFAVGLAWALFCALAIDALRYFRTRKPEVEEVEKDLDATADPGSDNPPQAARA
ncbi:MAG TPA: phosphatase PAP2 family protein [Longimicrobiaceae bacterium]|nr:phosphatase PAP2 family protein [Longimicrobiaceae bacterium]